MATKKQKRMAAEQRAQERDLKHQAEIKERMKAANHRKQRRLQREAEQKRKASTLDALRKLRGGTADV